MILRIFLQFFPVTKIKSRNISKSSWLSLTVDWSECVTKSRKPSSQIISLILPQFIIRYLIPFIVRLKGFA